MIMKPKISILLVSTIALGGLFQCQFPGIHDPVGEPPWKKKSKSKYSDPDDIENVDSPDYTPTAGTDGNASQLSGEFAPPSDLVADSEETSAWSRVKMTNFRFLSDPGNKLPVHATSIELSVADPTKDATATIYNAIAAQQYAGRRIRLTGEVSGLITRPGSVCEVMLRSWSGGRSLAARTTASFGTVRNAAQEMKTVTLDKTADVAFLQHNRSRTGRAQRRSVDRSSHPE